MILHLVPIYKKYSETFIWSLIEADVTDESYVVACSAGDTSNSSAVSILLGKDSSFPRRLIYKFANKFKASSFFHWKSLKRLIIKKNPSVVHAHFGYFLNDIAQIRKEFPAIRCLISMHGTDLNSIIRRSKGLRKVMLLLADDDAVTFTFPSEFLKNCWLKRVGSYKCQLKVIPNSVNPLFVNCWEKKATSKIRVLSVARLEEVKGITYLISAVTIIKSKGVDVEVRVIGDGSLKRRLLELVESEGLKEHFVFLGKKNPEQIIEYLRVSDVYVQPSITLKNGQQESFGISALEASVSGIPTIVSDSGGLPGVIDRENDNHYLVPERNSWAIANSILQAYEYKKYSKTSDLFILDHSREKINEIWKQVYTNERHY